MFGWRSFKVKVAVIFIAAILLVAAISNYFIYQFALDAQMNQLRDKLTVIAQTASLLIDADALASVPLSEEGISTPQFQSISAVLRHIRAVNQPIKYIYTLKKTDAEGILQFIVDADLAASVGKKRRFVTAYPGDKYDARLFPEMLKAFESPSADKKIGIDEWGATLSGYAPIYDKNNQVVGIIGVDLAATDVYNIQQQVHHRAAWVVLLSVLFSALVGFFVASRATKRIEKLVDGTRYLAHGDLLYRVEISGKDEIAELAASFNAMAKSLFESRKRLHSYFYGIMQSLVRVLEARDQYSRGHAEQVAECAAKIARKMGFSAERIELIREAALLHDIGKLGVQESILNKKEKLTEEEWAAIRRHPVIGEEILRPVLLNKELLEIIRSHHERFDGQGYPDKIRDGDIHIISQILSVADSYDAMTSERAYRKALSKEEAIIELEQNRGTQFNPRVADVLIEILRQEA